MNPVRCIQVLDGVIVNVILADPTTFQPDDGSVIFALDIGEIGDSYAGGVVTPAVVAAS